jgi:hypothetical protein
VFPETDDSPTGGTEGPFGGNVTFAIPAEFWEPVCTVGTWIAAVLWATVPEAAVNENSQTRAAEDKVRATGKRLVEAPAGDAGGAEDGCQFQLGVFVAAGTDGSHDLRALLLCEHVRHECKV